MNASVSYKPLRITLAELNMDFTDLDTRKGGVLNGRTVSKLRRDESVNIESIAKVCVFLNVPIEKVAEVVLDD